MKNLTRRERIGVLSLATVAILLISGAIFLRRQSSGVPDSGAPNSGVPVSMEYSPDSESVSADGSEENTRSRKNVKKRKKRKKSKKRPSGSERERTGSQDTSQYDPFELVPLKQHDSPAAE